MEKLLSIRNLKKNYHTLTSEIEAVKDFSYDFYDKEFISIVGPSGCGKSTILSIIAGIDTKSNGIISSKNNLILSYMLQNDALFEWLSVLDNCLVGLKVKGDLNIDSKAYVIKLLKTYGLEDFIDKYPNSLSGGMRQRVALIRTLAIKPDILLLDEPMSALDYQSRLAISEDIYNIIKKEGKTAIMVTHDIAEAISMSDKVIVLTNRPSTIKKVYKINFDNKSTPIKNRKSKDFFKYYDKIWSDLDVQI